MSGINLILPNGYTLEGIQEISFDISNSLWDEEVVRGSFSSAITIPSTAGNRVALGFSDVVEVVVDVSIRFEDVNLKIGGVQMIGDLVVIESSPTEFKGTLLLGWSKIMSSIKTDTLRSLDMPVIDLITNSLINAPFNVIDGSTALDYIYYMLHEFAPVIKDFNEAAIGTSPICFPYFQEEEGFHNQLKTVEVDDVIEVSSTGYSYKPWYFVKYLIEKIAEKYNLVLEGSFLDEEKYPFLIIPPNGLMGYRQVYKEVLPPPDPARGLVVIGFPETFNTKYCLPKIVLLDFIKRLRDHFFLAAYIDLSEQKMVLEKWDAILENTDVIDWTDKVESFENLKVEILDGYNFGYDTSTDKWAELSVKDLEEHTILDPVDLYSDLSGVTNPTFDSLVFVEQMGMYFYPAYDDLASLQEWKPYSYKAKGKQLDGGEYERPMILPTLDDCEIPGYDFDDEENNGVIWKQFEYISNYKVQKPVLETNLPDGQLRIAFWMGRNHPEDDPTSAAYYAASSVGEAMPGTDAFFLQYPSLPDYSLWADRKEGRPSVDKQGVFEKYGTGLWDLLKTTKKQRFKIRLTEADIFGTKPTQKIKIGNNLYLYDTMKPTFPITEATEVEMYWVPKGV